GPAPSGVSQVDAVEPVEVAFDSGATTGAEPTSAGWRLLGCGVPSLGVAVVGVARREWWLWGGG
ncbi:unnamed protein product, partial [Closterium sp. NIES-54]